MKIKTHKTRRSVPLSAWVGWNLLLLPLWLAAATPGIDFPEIIRGEDGRISVTAHATALKEVLQAFSDATGVKIVVNGPAEESISVVFRSLPEDEAIRTILGTRSSIGFYADRDPSEAGARRLTEVWVFRGFARPGRPGLRAGNGRVRRQKGSSLFNALKRSALTASDPKRRVHGIEALIESDEKKAKPVLVQALLNDKDARVRQAALENLLWYDEEAPQQVLTKAALRDSSPDVRRLALQEGFLDQAEDNKAARRVLIQALSDKDAKIRVSMIEALADIALIDEADRSVRSALARSIRDREESVRLAAVEYLEDTEMRKPLEASAKTDASAQVRAAAQAALDRMLP